MLRIENEDVSYNQLLVIDSDADKHTCDCLAISEDGELLFIREEETRSGNAYSIDRKIFLIDIDEYLKCLGIAAKNIRLQRSISKGTTALEVSYKGRYFSAGSSLTYIINHKECSIFTGDANIAKELDLNRIDKFEYEKTIRIKECDTVRITHKDTENEVIFLQQEFNPSKIEEWLDMLQQSIYSSFGASLWCKY